MSRSLVDLNLVVKEFLERHWDKKSPLALAYSGGPDSRGLFQALLNWGKAEVHLAHVDHGWREESKEEALSLKREAERLGAVFHLHRLEKKTTEEEARNERLAFFRALQKKKPLSGHSHGASGQ